MRSRDLLALVPAAGVALLLMEYAYLLVIAMISLELKASARNTLWHNSLYEPTG